MMSMCALTLAINTVNIYIELRSPQSIARLRIGEKLGRVPVESLAPPPKGWVAAIRDALGMSVRDLGRGMGTSGQRASKLEHDELTGAIQLSTLERAAAAMNCRLVYALIPNEPLEAMVQHQARKRAAEVVNSVAHSMRLEDQEVDDRVTSEQIDDLATELVDRRGLWAG